MLKCLLGNVNGNLGSNYGVINTVVLLYPLGQKAEEKHFNELPQVLAGMLQYAEPELNKMRDMSLEIEKKYQLFSSTSLIITLEQKCTLHLGIKKSHAIMNFRRQEKCRRHWQSSYFIFFLENMHTLIVASHSEL